MLNPFKACYIELFPWDVGEWKWEDLPNVRPKKKLKYLVKISYKIII
jgi:hypothetical protein